MSKGAFNNVKTTDQLSREVADVIQALRDSEGAFVALKQIPDIKTVMTGKQKVNVSRVREGTPARDYFDALEEVVRRGANLYEHRRMDAKTHRELRRLIRLVARNLEWGKEIIINDRKSAKRLLFRGRPRTNPRNP